jgi:hypothetical protein
MTADELFRQLTLESLSITSLQAQLLQGQEMRNVECNAHVELQLTPSAVEGAHPPQFALQVRLTCVGTPTRGVQRNRLFDLEIRALAMYRQVAGEVFGAAVFAANHAVCARQLFPALVARAQGLLSDLGMTSIRLPLDLPQQLTPTENQGPVVLN